MPGSDRSSAMCGLFGYVKLDGRHTPSVRRLVRMGRDMDSRGGHAAGLCIPSDEPASVTYWRGAMTAGELLPPILGDIAKSSRLYAIGHTRFATHGDSGNVDNLHPHPYSRDDAAGVIAHNGILWDHEKTARKYDIELIGECDSELFARLIEADPEPDLLVRVRHSIEACGLSDDIALTVAESTDDSHRIVLAARGNPLHYSIHHGVLYWSSTPTALPGGDVKRLPERAMLDMTAGTSESPVLLTDVLPQRSHVFRGYGYGWESYGRTSAAKPKAAPKAAPDAFTGDGDACTRPGGYFHGKDARWWSR